jgi:hypothetical protein
MRARACSDDAPEAAIGNRPAAAEFCAKLGRKITTPPQVFHIVTPRRPLCPEIPSLEQRSNIDETVGGGLNLPSQIRLRDAGSDIRRTVFCA